MRFYHQKPKQSEEPDTHMRIHIKYISYIFYEYLCIFSFYCRVSCYFLLSAPFAVICQHNGINHNYYWPYSCTKSPGR